METNLHGSVAPALIGFAGAILGAFAVIVGNILVEAYKRWRDRQAVCEALAAAVEARIRMIRNREHVKFFRNLLAIYQGGIDYQFTGVVDPENKTDRIADRFLDKIGMLPSGLSSRVVFFFDDLYGISSDILAIQRNEVSIEWKVQFIKKDLELWANAEALAPALIRDLRNFAQKSFREALLEYLNLQPLPRASE